MTDETKDDSSIDISLFDLPPAPDEIPLTVGQRLVAIGDVHGHCKHLKQCMQAGGISDMDDNWIAGNTILVQIGDILDRGTDELECLLLLCKLARQAKQAGGAVVVLLGNHEVENATGSFGCSEDYSKKWTKAFGALLEKLHGDKWKEPYSAILAPDSHRVDPARWAAMEPGGLLAKPLLSKLKIAVKVGKTVLVHAGLTVEHLENNGGIAGMNKAAKEWILDGSFTDRKLLREGTPAFLRSDDNPSPLWMRNYSHPPNKDPNKEDARSMAESVLKYVDADRIVVGHTVQDRINSVFDGKIWRVDIGDGVPLHLRMASCIENPSEIRRECLEIKCVESEKEKVAVYRRIEHSYYHDKVTIVRDKKR